MNRPLDLDPRRDLPAAPAFDAVELAAARAAAGRSGRLVDALLEGEDGLRRLAATLRLEALTMAELRRARPVFDRVSFAEALQRECVLIEDADARGTVRAVVADPFDLDLLEWLDGRAPGADRPAVARREDLQAFLAACEGAQRATDGLLAQAADPAAGAAGEDISLRRISEDASPVVRLVNSTLHDALKAGASDIHLETSPGGLHIKYRVDGVLVNVGSAPGAEIAEHAISRVKVMAELDIAERRVPQDGRLKVSADGREIDIRVSIMPSIFGEDAVLRVLDKRSLAAQLSTLSLDSLGFDAATRTVLRRLAAEPHGMLLVTGPTGSGKTTTLYAAISEINNGRDKIVTIEDPVEYQLPGVLQIPVNERKGLTFARGLRSILRHDPDKIMVGEIRDGETAGIAVQAALTGHLVLTTVHANSVFDVLGRFTHMDVDPYSLVSALNGIVAQRLLRMNCQDCAEDAVPSPELMAAARLDSGAGLRFRAGQGCAQCHGTGYRGRRAVAEILVLDDELREMIAQREPTRRIKEVALTRGARPLRAVALDLVASGETSLEEFLRVVA